MSFQSFGFLAFLAVTAGVCLLPGGRRFRLGFLTAASLVFYIAGAGWRGLAVLVLGLCVSAGAVRYAERTVSVPAGGPGGPDRRDPRVRLVFGLAAAWHIGVLAVFKYSGFLTGGLLSVPWAPLGLSFFTFQQLWLLHETAHGRFHPEHWDELLLYGFFFPTVVSGPILKPQAFFPQLHGETRPCGQDLAAGLYAIAAGTMKKVLLADNLGVVVNNGWARLGDLSAPAAWLVILGYTLQLYLDFSGYCDIAAGAARLLGLRLPVNFNSPYRSLSVGEFWKRWHITLTSFLRECLYFPLGGSKKGPARTYLNILIVFLVSGLWHGAGWTFLVWGGLHGLGQIGERLWGQRRERLPVLVRWGLTFAFVNLAWVFFRAPGLGAAGELLSAAVTGGLARPDAWLLEGLLTRETMALGMLLPALKPWMNILRLFLLYGVSLAVVLWPRNALERAEDFRPAAWRCALLALGLSWSILSFSNVVTFIYSNF